MRSSQLPEPPPPIVEATEFGDYVLLERIGVGGMAEVFRAETRPRAGAPRAVVVKRMLPHIAAEPGAERMFQEEARLGQRVDHPNVVQVIELGDVDGTPYLALELVPGLDLARLGRWLRAGDLALEPALALFAACELLAGLHAVHEALDGDGAPLGIVHGDVSPSNVLVSIHGEVKLADFGIAEARLRQSFPQAAARRTKGKLGYLSPEQVRGEPTDRRADVFAASVLIAEMLVGEPLFARGSELMTLLAVREAQVGPLEARRDQLPEGVVDALLAGLARDPADRLPSAAALHALLAPRVTAAPADLAEALAHVVAEAMGGPVVEDDARDEAVTLEPPLDDYHVEPESGGTGLGPLTFAQLVEAVTTGKVAHGDRVRVGEGPSRRVRDIGELTGYLPGDRRGAESGDALDLGSGAFLDGLARSIAARSTGVWVCRRGEVRKEVYLIEGTPEFVSSNLPEELLGEFLVTTEVLRRDELDMALAVLPRFEGRLGDTLAALGLIEPVELFRHIGAQVNEKLMELFSWTDGTARFHEGVAPPERYFPLGLDAWSVLGDGIDRRLGAGLMQERFTAHMLDHLGRTPTTPPDGLPQAVHEVLAVTRRPRPLQEVVDALEDPLDRDRHRPYRAIRLALALDLVRWMTPDAAPS